MFTFNYQLRVRYGDTDQMGYVYYGNYAYYYEQARAEALRSLGFSYKELEEMGTMMPITRMNIKYIKPALYDELLTIKAIVPQMPHRIIIFQYEVYNEKQELINEGENHLIFVDSVTRRIKTAPEILSRYFQPFFK
ncbi:MAG: acyl-CoA thioesterase [Chitinophagales bacterium]|nr:acyl-CoA thioesterase [Chitinophagales bacterium]